MGKGISRYAAALLFCCAMALPAVEIRSDSIIGLGALIYGWVGIDRPYGWAWLANPLFIFTVFVLYQRKRIWRRIAIYTAAAAFLLSCSFCLVDQIPGNRGEVLTGVVRRDAGYWVWLGSMAALVIAAVLNKNGGPGNPRSAA